MKRRINFIYVLSVVGLFVASCTDTEETAGGPHNVLSSGLTMVSDGMEIAEQGMMEGNAQKIGQGIETADEGLELTIDGKDAIGDTNGCHCSSDDMVKMEKSMGRGGSASGIRVVTT